MVESDQGSQHYGGVSARNTPGYMRTKVRQTPGRIGKARSRSSDFMKRSGAW